MATTQITDQPDSLSVCSPRPRQKDHTLLLAIGPSAHSFDVRASGVRPSTEVAYYYIETISHRYHILPALRAMLLRYLEFVNTSRIERAEWIE